MTVTDDLPARPRHGAAYAFLTLTMLFWAGNAVAGRLAVGEVSPMLLVAVRWSGTVLLLLAVGARQLRRDWPALRPRLLYVAAMGGGGMAVFNGLFYIAAHGTTAVNIGILQGAMPMMILLGSVVLFRTRPGVLQVVGAGITLGGVVLVVSKGQLAVLMALAVAWGDLLMVAASVVWAGYSLGLRYQPVVSHLSLLSVFAMAAALASLPLAGVEAAMGQAVWPSGRGWAVVAYVTVFPSFLAQLFYIKGVGLIGPARAGVFINLVPVFAAGLGVAILGEAFRWYHFGALVLVLAGIWMTERRPKSLAG